MCKSSTDGLKIWIINPVSYILFIRCLNDENAEFHTYQLKESKSIRIVIRNLYSTASIDIFKEELEIHFFLMRKVTNVLHKINKNTLLLVSVDL